MDEEPQLADPTEQEDANMKMDIDMLDQDESFHVTLEPEANQRSLHDFFRGHASSAPKQRSMHDFFGQCSSESRRIPEPIDQRELALPVIQTDDARSLDCPHRAP